MTEHEPYMSDTFPVCEVCSLDREGGLDYCSSCGKPLSDNAEALDHKLKSNLPDGWLL